MTPETETKNEYPYRVTWGWDYSQDFKTLEGARLVFDEIAAMPIHDSCLRRVDLLDLNEREGRGLCYKSLAHAERPLKARR